jgi:acyl-CoA reductase-like NAD-dependent aldehyde dehydrogenase
MLIKSINPADGVQIATFDAAGEVEARDAIVQGRAVQASWAALPISERAGKLSALADMLKSRGPEILEVIQTETGRVKPDAEAELFDVIDAIPYFIAEFDRMPISKTLNINAEAFPDTEIGVWHAPHGVVALIMPWNFPFYLPMMTSIAALLTGNVVIIKPSEYSTLVGYKVGELFNDAGFPPGVVQVLPGADDTGRALVDAKPDKIFFVGSVATGKEIIARSGVTPVQVELGGNSAALVLEDADVDLAAAGIAWAGTYHAGQDCAGIKRIFVHRNVADEFIQRTKAILESLRPGIDYGPYITAEARDTVRDRVKDAVAAGAKLVIGADVNEASPGNWMTPSLLVVEDPSIELVAKETFGNVLPVHVVDDTDDAVAAANDTTFGLSTAIFTRDLKEARRIADLLLSGMVFINDPFINLPGSDHWTGWRDSGFGTMESKLEQCLRKKVIGANLGGIKRDFWYPY